MIKGKRTAPCKEGKNSVSLCGIKRPSQREGKGNRRGQFNKRAPKPLPKKRRES